MFPELINLEYLSEIQQVIEGLAGIRVSVFDCNGRAILESMNEDPILSFVVSSETGKEEYNSFIKENVKKAILRKDITISKIPTGQYLFFIPYHQNDFSLIIVGGAFYLSDDDYKAFISDSVYKYHFSFQQLESLSEKILIMDYENIQKKSLYIQKLLISTIKNGYERKLYKEKYNHVYTVIRLLSDSVEDISQEKTYSLLSDALLFIFNIDSMAFFSERGRIFRPDYSAGRLKGSIDSLSFNRNSWIISEAIKGPRPLYFDDSADIRNLGLTEDFESVYFFHFFSEKMGSRFLCLFNVTLSLENEEEISMMCQILNLFSAAVSSHNNYNSRLKEMTTVSLAMSNLNLKFNRPEELYSSIVDTAVSLSNAERGSLMLADNGGKELCIKAVHGINKWLVKDLKIKVNEGIAGKIYRENIPVVSSDVEKDFSVKKKTVYKTNSFMSIPLRIGDETIGVLNLSDKITGEIFNKEDLDLIFSFASYASIALKGSSYYSLAEQMKELSITDSLTDLFNRRYFQDRLAEEIDRSERHSLSFSLCIIDIDDFKLYNDSEGHPAGDELLKRLSKIIHNSLRAADVLARIGGEEFAMIMPQTDKDEAYFVAERIRNTVRQQLYRTWKFYPKENITVSMGISTFPADETKAKKLIWKADKALYRAKMHGKDQTFVWEEQADVGNSVS